MILRWERGAGLGGRGDLTPAFAAWLGRDDAAGAAGETAAALVAGACAPAPLFTGAAGRSWREAKALADGWSPDRLAAAGRGELRFVVTGQQPGFLGGPQLILAKVATAIALAGTRTASGRPTLAVFWCADDDDDLVEALGPAGWDPRRDELVRAAGRLAARRAARERVMVGGMAADRWCGPGAALLAGLAGLPGAGALAADLRDLWDTALAGGWTWSDLNVAALQRIFAGCDLAVVRGNDPALHAAASPFYEALAGHRQASRELVAARGRELATGGRVPALSERSLRHHLFTAADGRRAVLPEDRVLPDAASLRPGVMLRSLVQDWLLRPAGVVVGPGELAYLEELEPLYAELGAPRPARVPRLFAWLLPPGIGAGALAAVERGPVLGAADASALAAELGRRAAGDLEAALEARLGLAPGRAQDLAAARARRWQRGLAALLRDEGRRARAARAAALPACLFPDGLPQERRLAAAAAAAAWGDGLAGALVAAAGEHLARGAGRSWHQYHVLATGG